MRTSDVEENHTQQDQQQVDNLALKILLVENHGTEEEGNQHTTATYHDTMEIMEPSRLRE